ncbi:imidazole glycerol phosphate synthase subunit HisF [bacterium]|nr:imidazole glycerol phosphate synthase subunit HisF [bacterium]
MLTKRIIPCLDILQGRVVKGKQFVNLIDAGDPVELAARYSHEGADELVILDISATLENRNPFYEMVERIARTVAIPLTVGGGIRTVEDIVTILRCGADKVSLNTILSEHPEILSEAAERVGTQALVAALDAESENGTWRIKVRSGTQATAMNAIDWAKRVVELGAGELLITSIDRDGMKSGYDCALLKRLSDAVRVPIVASGGAGSKEHLLQVLRDGNADAVLAASIFHFGEISIQSLKEYLRNEKLPVRL